MQSTARSGLWRSIRRGLRIDARTARCRWGGERMDYNIAIEALCREVGYP